MGRQKYKTDCSLEKTTLDYELQEKSEVDRIRSAQIIRASIF